MLQAAPSRSSFTAPSRHLVRRRCSGHKVSSRILEDQRPRIAYIYTHKRLIVTKTSMSGGHENHLVSTPTLCNLVWYKFQLIITCY